MNIIYSNNDIQIFKEDTLIIGWDINLKAKIITELQNSADVDIIDQNFLFATNTVKEALDNYGVPNDYFKDTISKNISSLTLEEYYYLAIYLKIYQKPNILIIDQVLAFVNDKRKIELINIAKNNNITLIIFNNDLNPVYKSFNTIVLYDGKLAINGEYKDVVKEDKILKRLGFEVPFYVDLSGQLKLYGLIGNVCYDQNELEDALWK